MPTLTELMRASRFMSREESTNVSKEVVRRLLAMQNEVNVSEGGKLSFFFAFDRRMGRTFD